MVVSLEDHDHIAALLGYCETQSTMKVPPTEPIPIPKELLHTLLVNLRFYTVCLIIYHLKTQININIFPGT